MSISNFETQEEMENELEKRLDRVADLLPDAFRPEGAGLSRYGKVIGHIEHTEEGALSSLNVGRTWIDGMPLPDSMSYPDDEEWLITPMGLDLGPDLPEYIIYVRILDVSPEETASRIKEEILDRAEDL